MQVEMPNVVRQPGASQKRGQGWAVGLGIISVSMVISDQMPLGSERRQSREAGGPDLGHATI